MMMMMPKRNTFLTYTCVCGCVVVWVVVDVWVRCCCNLANNNNHNSILIVQSHHHFCFLIARWWLVLVVQYVGL